MVAVIDPLQVTKGRRLNDDQHAPHHNNVVPPNSGPSILIGEIMQILTHKETCDYLKSCHHAHDKTHVDDGDALFLGFERIEWRHLGKRGVAHEGDAAQRDDQVPFSLIRHGLLSVSTCTSFTQVLSATKHTG